MFDLQRLVRPSILKLKPYSSARDEYQGTEGIFLDANENPYGTLNRYPDPYQRELKEKLAVIKGVSQDQIFVGNGSDEVIDLAFRIFCTPGTDKALSFAPSYGMYEVSAAINDVELIKVPLDANFQINRKELDPYLTDPTIKLLFICTPNNPTGNLIRKEDLLYVLDSYSGLVIIDEAYMDFALNASNLDLLQSYPNLLICQTMSKAWGLAAARVGAAYASSEIVELLNKVKPPYNISLLNQKAAIAALENETAFKRGLDEIKIEKAKLIQELRTLPIVKKIYPSDANFLLVEITEASKIYQALIDQQIIIRNRARLVPNCVRITVGTPAENSKLITALKELS